MDFSIKFYSNLFKNKLLIIWEKLSQLVRYIFSAYMCAMIEKDADL